MGRKNRAYPHRLKRSDRNQCRHRRSNPVSARNDPDLRRMCHLPPWRIHDRLAFWLYKRIKSVSLDDDDADDPGLLRDACAGRELKDQIGTKPIQEKKCNEVSRKAIFK